MKIALICDKCGDKLVYNGNLITVCASCGTQFAMVADKGEDLRQVSYRPLPVAGQMTIPLKILLSNLFREKGFLFCEREFWPFDVFFNEDGESDYPDKMISNDEEPLCLGVGEPLRVQPAVITTQDWLSGLFSKLTTVKEKQDPKIETTMKIYVDEVLVKGQLIGNSVRIEVLDPSHEADANKMCDLILENFGIVPTCTLVWG